MFTNGFRVLVLNSSYEPLQFCNARRAITLVIKGKAEKIELSEMVIRSPSLSLRLPIVIRLNRYIKIPFSAGMAFSKKNVFKRDNHRCQYCGDDAKPLSLDHVIPRSRGGITCWENVVVACQECNKKKGDKTLQEAGMRLLRAPKKPHVFLYLNMTRLTYKNYQEVWNKYLPSEVQLRVDREDALKPTA